MAIILSALLGLVKDTRSDAFLHPENSALILSLSSLGSVFLAIPFDSDRFDTASVSAMVLLGINLGIGTSMFASVAIGLGVDFVIHALDRLRSLYRAFDFDFDLDRALGNEFSSNITLSVSAEVFQGTN